MALYELEESEDDYVFLSDVECDTDYAANSLRPRRSQDYSKALASSSQQHQSQGHSSQHYGTLHKSQEEEDSDLEDIETIEYGYENDTLLIMPAMLRDYSHHATNYHPELWRSPIPGSYTSQPSLARCRQEDRMLDRQELLKNSISPTTCGICFEAFTTFNLDPLQQPEVKTKEISSQAQFALSFTARLARSFLSRSNNHSNYNSISIPGADISSPPASPTEASFSSPSTSATPAIALSPSNKRRSSIGAATITPSLSAKDLGIVMSCDHGLCLSCLQSFLTNTTQTPQARFPTLCPQPGCRTPIPIESAELVLDAETLEIWYRKLAEVHVANKVCCPRQECRSIIDLDDRDGTAVTCPECRSSFCASCAVPFHRGLTCEQYQAQTQGGDSEEDRAMLQLVQDRHWRHCPSCRFVIEKQQGCNHMVCHCGQSFCYACGHPWNELDARCSRDCESYGVHEDIGVDCIIM
ncbi:hypothetical protein BC939DRAFT_452607 [Gamsiella multidivaricata]|uniref:uncharacterized protein n=1 Tax=Gamsiella multidivaricata TaxID=101098 RepID=UPI00221E7E47|nr:uncharacterized protein BC939DRAFT_452607 [Gamsiella multidivaricata]KAI7823041.1 hypothetical protein BC939DRAFT_452607 [Gamsiella multidivaricata]